MTAVVLYDDARARTFEPFASTRPVLRARGRHRDDSRPLEHGASAGHRSELRCRRATSGLRRARRHAGGNRDDSARLDPRERPRRSRSFHPILAKWRVARRPARCGAAATDSRLCASAFRSTPQRTRRRNRDLGELHAGTGAIGDVKGWWLENVWDLIRFLPEMLSSDIGETALQPPIVAALDRARLRRMRPCSARTRPDPSTRRG